jgi:putative ABC transport system permease protein
MNQLFGPNRRGFFFRIWWRSVSVKRPQAMVALLSLVVGAAVMSMLLNLYGGVRRKMTQDFRAYGANVVLAPGASTTITHPHALLPSPAVEGNQEWGSTMDQSVMSLVQERSLQGRSVTALPMLYGVVHLRRVASDSLLPDFVNVVAVGTDLAGLSRMNPGWRESKAMAYTGALSLPVCAVGARIASRFHVASGDTLYLDPLAPSPGGLAEAGSTYRLAMVFTTGESEDDQVFLPLEELQRMMGMTGRISLVQLRLEGETSEIERAIREVSKALPGVDVRPIRQIVYSEGRVLGVIRWFLLSVAALILVIIVICLMATMLAIALERRKDIGVMKALGASDFHVMRLFLMEGAALGLAGGCTGFFLGSFWAFGLARHLFGVTLEVIWWALPLVCGLAVLLALGASVSLVGLVQGIQPAVVLKGE